MKGRFLCIMECRSMFGFWQQLAYIRSLANIKILMNDELFLLYIICDGETVQQFTRRHSIECDATVFGKSFEIVNIEEGLS